MFVKIPFELQQLDQWVVATGAMMPDGTANKVPLNPRSGQKADVTDSTTWGSFADACNCGYKFIGFVLSKNDPYTIIDLDSPINEVQVERHQKILDSLDSYTELSQSGNGVHIICRGKIPHGVRRDKVEIYSQARYMICTGQVIKDLPIADCQAVLDGMYSQMNQAIAVELTQVDGILSDDDLYAMATRAGNADKFNSLWVGEWIAKYPSQSEADFALLSMLAFYTKDNEQVRRLFRASSLGQREKAQRNNKYIDTALTKIRGNQLPEMDFSRLLTSLNPPPSNEIASPTETRIESQEATTGDAVATPGEEERPRASVSDSDGGDKSFEPVAEMSIAFPPGFIGELAGYIFGAAIRPVPEIGLAAAIALTAGVCGRAYNISGTGLNQYLILLAKTGSGKEGAATGIDGIVDAVRSQCPMVDEFIGPGAFASGQALIRVLDKHPCFVSVLGEFGLTLQQLCDPKASPAHIMLKKVLLDIYSKSGDKKVLRSSVYSDTEKNTQIIQAPNVTIFGESTPETFYNGLDASAIGEGLIPRFSIFEYSGPRPMRNPMPFMSPAAGLVNQFAGLLAVALAAKQNRVHCPVPMDGEAKRKLDEFDALATDQINADQGDIARQLWNRAHLKALKLAALVAVGINPHSPSVDKICAEWAIALTQRDISKLLDKFSAGDIGFGDVRMESDVKRAVEDYLGLTHRKRREYDVPETLIDKELVPLCYLRRRLRTLSSFRNDRRGSSAALTATLNAMVEGEVLDKIPQAQLLMYCRSNSPAYVKGPAWGKAGKGKEEGKGHLSL